MTETNNVNKNELREAVNIVTLEGVLLEKSFEERTLKTQNGDRVALSGELTIETKENEVHTVSMFTFKEKTDGNVSGLYTGFKTIENDYKTVKDNGREEADKVRITQGSVGLNEYYGQDGKLKSFPQIGTKFVNRLKTDDEFNPRAEFDVEVVVNKSIEEVKNEEETCRVKFEGFIPLYGGKVIPFNFIVGEEGSEYVKDTYEQGQTVRVYGEIINFKETKITKVEAAFGKDKEVLTYNTVREYLITGGSEPYDEDNVNTYDPKLIKKALTEREAHLAEMLKKKEAKDNTPTANAGFGGTKKTDAKPEKKAAVDVSNLF
jgi:hypothetical protein